MSVSSFLRARFSLKSEKVLVILLYRLVCSRKLVDQDAKNLALVTEDLVWN